MERIFVLVAWVLAGPLRDAHVGACGLGCDSVRNEMEPYNAGLCGVDIEGKEETRESEAWGGGAYEGVGGDGRSDPIGQLQFTYLILMQPTTCWCCPRRRLGGDPSIDRHPDRLGTGAVA